MYDAILVKHLIKKPPVIILVHENMHPVMNKFDETVSSNLPVVDNGEYVGFISKSTLLTKYRFQLIQTSVD